MEIILTPPMRNSQLNEIRATIQSLKKRGLKPKYKLSKEYMDDCISYLENQVKIVEAADVYDPEEAAKEIFNIQEKHGIKRSDS